MKNVVGGFFAGIIMIIVGVCLLWYNEGRTVKTQKAIAEATKNYTQVKSDKVNEKYNNKLIATNGKLDLSNSKELVDETFGVKAQSAKMERIVEMYQWSESCESDDNNKEKCSYKKKWSDSLIDSSEFKESGHDNPSSMSYENEEYVAQNAKVGAFDLPEDLEKKLSTEKSKGTEELTTEFNNRIQGLKVTGKYINNIPENNIPEIGNIRISFNYNDATSLSILAQQTDNTFTKYIAKSGIDVYRVKEGTHTGEVILQDMADENNLLKWLLRLGGTLLVIFGIAALFSPITTFTNFVPVLGGLVSLATGLVAFLVGSAISLVVIALAWFRFRPVLSIVLIAVVIALIIILRVLSKKKQANNEQPQQVVEQPQDTTNQ